MKFFYPFPRMRFIQNIIGTSFLLTCLLCSSAAIADSVDSLSLFLKSTRSMRADFVQTVISPAKENRPAKSKTSLGTFAFIRPAVFRFDYTKPFVQNIVADGQFVWLYDADLNQVTQRNQSQALATTPASLIASANDVTSLQKEFVLLAQPDADGLQWVAATPHSSDSSLQRVRIGLRVKGDTVQLAQLDIWDVFGTRSLMKFEQTNINPKQLTLSQFNFVPPKGADVIKP
jgi:outer membrane lipoprotein carrier protein